MTHHQQAVQEHTTPSYDASWRHRALQRVIETANTDLVHYRSLLPTVSFTEHSMTYYVIGDGFGYHYFMEKSVAQTKLKEALQDLQERLEHMPSELRSSSAIQRLLLKYQNIGVQEHTGVMKLYTVHHPASSPGEQPPKELVTIDPTTVEDTVYVAFQQLKKREDRVLSFVGIEYRRLDDHDVVAHARDMHIYHTAPFQQVLQRYAHETEKYDNFLHFVCIQAGFDNTAMWEIHQRLKDSSLLQKHIIQFAVQLWYQQWSLDIAPNLGTDVPKAWEESMIDYRQIWDGVLHHANTLTTGDTVWLYRTPEGAFRYSVYEAQKGTPEYMMGTV